MPRSQRPTTQLPTEPVLRPEEPRVNPRLPADETRNRVAVLVPLTGRDASQMVREIKGFPVLEGARGRDASDISAIEQLILKVSAFAEANPQVEEIDLNPVFAYPDGVIAVDAENINRTAMPVEYVFTG